MRNAYMLRPVLVGTDGEFTIANLAPGEHVLHAYRTGGGEAFAEHVAIGSRVTLQLRKPGAIAGTVRHPRGAALGELIVLIRGGDTGTWRTERFLDPSGHFEIRDLATGKYILRFDAATGSKVVERIDVTDGATTTANIELAPSATVVGRVIELQTRAPIAGAAITCQQDSESASAVPVRDRKATSDVTGAFRCEHMSPGHIAIAVAGTTEHASITAHRDVTGERLDAGDIALARLRTRDGADEGVLGFAVTFDPSITVSSVEDAGPAARAGLRVGDVIVSVDGIDVRDEAVRYFKTLVKAPVGTRLVLGLARGTSIAITLARPTDSDDE